MIQDTPGAHPKPVATPVPPQSAVPNTPVPTAPAKPKKPTGREARRRRRRTRHRSEEILAWFLVPVILVGLFWGATSVMDFFGTTPGQVWDQAMQLKAALEKKAK